MSGGGGGREGIVSFGWEYLFIVCIDTGDSSGSHCCPRGGMGNGVRLPEDEEEGEEQTEEGRSQGQGEITTTQPKWSAVAALENS